MIMNFTCVKDWSYTAPVKLRESVQNPEVMLILTDYHISSLFA